MNLPDDKVSLDAAQAINEQGAIEVIHLVLKRARQQPGAFVLLRLTVAVEALDDGAHRAHDRRVEARNAEAPFFFELDAVALDELRVDQHHQAVGIPSDRHVYDENTQRHPDLRRGQADAGGGVLVSIMSSMSCSMSGVKASTFRAFS